DGHRPTRGRRARRRVPRLTAGALHHGRRPRHRRHYPRIDLMSDFSSFGLTDKIAIVTGASQGIGKAIALGLAQAGAHLVLAKYPSGGEQDIQAVKAEIEALGRRAIIVPTDVSVKADLDNLMQKAVEEYGRIDILVNNASWTGTTLALEVTEEEYDKTMTASLKSVFFAC